MDWQIDYVLPWSEKVRCSSKIKPRLRAEWVVMREESYILESCCLSLIRRNSVLEELKVRRLYEF